MSIRSPEQAQSSVGSMSSSDDEEELSMLRKLANLEIKEETPPHHLGTGFTYHPVMTLHKCEWDENYPENPQRILAPYQRCQDLGLVPRCKSVKMRYATEDEILQGHVTEHVEKAKATANMNLEELMEFSSRHDSWYANQSTFEAALASAGSTITLVDYVIHDKVTNGFAMVRPPGHHAMENEFNGYCTFNNVVLAAKSALERGIERIMIVDWDVHHGQGVQRQFYDDPRVLYLSIHRYEYGEFWPNLRESDYDYIGEKKGRGFNVNVPLNKIGMNDSDYMAILNQLILPLAYEFSPQLVLISSGYDAAVGWPEGEMSLTPRMYAHMTYHLMALATGRVCAVLEGGYCIKSLAEGCALTLRSLLLDPCPQMPPLGEPSDSIATSIVNAIKMLRPYWRCFKHYQFLGDAELCPLEGVNTMPPVEGVDFLTPAKYPEHFDVYGRYPVQTPEQIKEFSDIIDQLMSETNLSKAQNRCCYVFDADMRAHRNLHSKCHPERPDRISSIFNKLVSWSLLDRCLAVPSRMARKSEIAWIHKDSYIEEMCKTQTMTDDELESLPFKRAYNSVYVHQKSLHCALLSCGSLLNVTEAVLTGQAQSGIAVIRPPGHHAECSKAMGFCFFNNVAVAAKFAQNKFNIKRILILDWDIHHGNASQHQFYDDPSVLYISLHRYDTGYFFPGSPDADLQNIGGPRAEGYNVNIPWSYGRMGDSEYLTAFTQIVMPIAYQFAPELVLVSAGFDAAIGDPLGGYHVSPAGYGHMTHMLAGLANGKVVLALEGGYNLLSISESMATCTSVLLGDPCPFRDPLEPCESAMNVINQVQEIQKEYWPSLKCQVRIPAYPASAHGVKASTGDNQTEAKDGAGSASVTSGSLAQDMEEFQTKSPAPADDIPEPTKSDATEPEPRDEVKSEHLPDDKPLSEGLSAVRIDDTIPEQKQQQQQQQENDGVEESKLQRQDGGAEDGKEELEEEEEEDLSGGQTWPPVVQGSFQSTVYEDHPDCESLSIFMEKDKGTSSATSAKQEPNVAQTSTVPDVSQESTPSDDVSPGDLGDGACGGSSRPNTVEEFLQMEGASHMYAVQPLPWCPHLSEVTPIPTGTLDTREPCATCGDTKENWVCLTCYKVECSRYVNEHMLYHRLETEHNVCLSYSDLSVWCYCCENYVDNEVLRPMKSAAHLSKFGEALP